MKRPGNKKIASIAAVVCMTVLGSHDPASAGGAFKFGGGVFLDDNVPGINAAVDLPVREGIASISIFSDVFSKSTTKIFAGGVNLLKKEARETADRNVTLYFGGGGGIGRVEVTVLSVSASKVQAMADALIGMEYPLGEKAMIFGQVKWIGIFGGEAEIAVGGTSIGETVDLSVRHFAIEVGVGFGG